MATAGSTWSSPSTTGGSISGFGGLSVLLGKGDGTFQPPRSNLTGLVPASIAEGDFNNDGRLDMVVANLGSNDISVLLGNGDGTFQPATDYSFGTACRATHTLW